MRKTLVHLLIVLSCTSCIDPGHSLFNGLTQVGSKRSDSNGQTYDAVTYLYPYDKEVQGVTAEITIKLKNAVKADIVSAETPVLKYNKSWLMMLTQDDCMQSAFCRTWTAINGRPVSSSEQYPTPSNTEPNKKRDLYFDIEHAQYNDFPPNVYSMPRTLGMTDGTGREVRFGFTTTLAPEESSMDVDVNVRPGFTDNYARFYRKTTLRWINVYEMMNYGVSIALHDVSATDVKDRADVKSHIITANDIVCERLNGRQCKLMAEPNGNQTYLEASMDCDVIRTMTSQGDLSVKLFPWKLTSENVDKAVWERIFYTDYETLKDDIAKCLNLAKEERNAIYVGMHNTGDEWDAFMRWLDEKYGKDGDDSVWFTSQEEFYEYSYFRLIGGAPRVEKISDKEYKIIVNLPSKGNFYYPSTTVNIAEIEYDNIANISTSEAITGLTYGKYNDGTTINIDCRKYLAEMAEHYVEVYEQETSNTIKQIDAAYFVAMLKESDKKDELLKRIK